MSDAVIDYDAAAVALGVWYEKNGRKNLPWRNESDPYRVYVSEIMLQQTQVATVEARFYRQFLRRFPTLAALAGATQEDVLKAWQGLGYYSRARNMHKAAQITAPFLPDTPEELKKLPGIGEYVANAVACFGFGKAVAIVDVNVKRVICRMTASRTATDKEIRRHAADFLDKNNAFRHNQAMLDVGATVCTAKVAKCDICPLSAFCMGKNEPLSYPAPKVKKSVPIEILNVGIFTKNDGVMLIKRQTAFLGGYYTLPVLPRQDAESLHFVGKVEQTYSHKKIVANIYKGAPSFNSAASEGLWVKLSDVHALPLSAIDQKMIAYV